MGGFQAAGGIDLNRAESQHAPTKEVHNGDAMLPKNNAPSLEEPLHSNKNGPKRMELATLNGAGPF